MSSWLVHWDIELSEFDIQYKSRLVIKSQALVDFVIECTISDEGTTKRQETTPKDKATAYDWPWILHVDASTALVSGACIILTTPEGMTIEYAFWFTFSATNNEAEYEALIVGLKLTEELNIPKLRVFSDFRLVIGQINGEFKARSPTMAKNLTKVKEIRAKI